MANEQLLRFYAGVGTDHRGRTIEDIWSFSRDELEHVHDYIQWLFPLDEPSAFNPDAPLVDAETATRFRDDAELRGHLQVSLTMMRNFYFGGESTWVTPHNHNFLRLTRMLKSLTLLGLGDKATELLAQLETVYRAHPGTVGATTLAYWRNAVGR